jgi:opacity protein-like surface antigen
MKRSVLGVMTAILAITASAPAVQAQNPMTFGIAAGASIPMGDLGDDFAKTGWHGMATLGFMPAMLPFGMRIDGMYNSMSLEDALGDASVRIIGANVNAIIAMPAMVASPYLIGGIGMYNSKIDTDDDLDFDTDGSTDFGINVGIGTKFNLSGFGTFAEIRYHNIFSEGSSTQFLPITFGIMF